MLPLRGTKSKVEYNALMKVKEEGITNIMATGHRPLGPVEKIFKKPILYYKAPETLNYQDRPEALFPGTAWRILYYSS